MSGFELAITNIISQPSQGYISTSVQSIIFDDQRQALYAMYAGQSPDFSQNMRIYFIISRNNGQTWSNPIEIATTKFANRGFQSMTLDTVTRALIFGWYDGRNDPTFKSVQYFGAKISAKKLDCLVNSIPLSNPLYVIPSSADPKVTMAMMQNKKPLEQKNKEAIKAFLKKKSEKKHLFHKP